MSIFYLAQTPPLPPPQDFKPPVVAPEPPKPIAPPNPLSPTPANTPVPTSPAIELLTVKSFTFTGNTVFSSAELAQQVTTGLLNRPLSTTELLQIGTKIAELYADRGYRNSGAKIVVYPIAGQPGLANVDIQTIENQLEQIEIVGNRRLPTNYIRSRLALVAPKPLNIDRLQSALQVLQINPLIKRVTARLSQGSQVGKSRLLVEIEEAPSLSANLSTANNRSPSIGTTQQRGVLAEGNLFGFGDTVAFGYARTDGSNGFDVNYTLPLNPQNGTLNLSYNNTNSRVIEAPFDRLDITANFHAYDLTYRQPLLQTFNSQGFQEFALSLGASRRESNTNLLNAPYPLSPGADNNGSTRVSAIRFGQEWTSQRPQSAIAIRSQVSLGSGAFNATINQPISPSESVPDSRFVAWQGQAQWVNFLGETTNPTVLLVRGNAQLADRLLLASEQFGLGGAGSVRGYRQDSLLTDNGVFGSSELQIPCYRTTDRQGVLQVVPFIDVGTGWNSGGRERPNPNTLIGTGLGLQWRQSNLTARIDWGIPVVSLGIKPKTWQENGLYFSVQYNP